MNVFFSLSKDHILRILGIFEHSPPYTLVKNMPASYHPRYCVVYIPVYPVLQGLWHY